MQLKQGSSLPTDASGEPVPAEHRPAGRHFQLSSRWQWLHFVPIQLILSCFGMAGLASCWTLAAKLFQLVRLRKRTRIAIGPFLSLRFLTIRAPCFVSAQDSFQTVSHVWAWWVLVHTIVFLLLYVVKSVCSMGEVHREWTSHSAFNYFCAVPLSLFVLGGMVHILWPSRVWLARVLWIIGTSGDMIFNVYAIRRWLGGQGDEDARKLADEHTQQAHRMLVQAQEQPTWDSRGPVGDVLEATTLIMARRLSLFSPFFLTSPSTGFYASLLGTTLWSSSTFTEEFLWLPWSLGALMLLLFFVLLVNRLVLLGMMGSEARPTMMLPLANFAMATAAYIQLNAATEQGGQAPYDNFARTMFFVSVSDTNATVHKCVYGCSVCLMLPDLFCVGFSVKWFSTTFPVSALASLLVLHQQHQATRVGAIFALIALAAATVWNIGVLLLAYTSILSGNMFVAHPKAAPHLLPGVTSLAINRAAQFSWLLCAIGLLVALLVTVDY